MKIHIQLFDDQRQRWTIQGACIISHLKSLRHIHKWAQKYVALNAPFYKLNTTKYKLDFYGSNIYGQPNRTIEV